MRQATFKSAKGQIAKQKDTLYKGSFQDLPDGATYWDPMGWRTGQPTNHKQKMWEALEEKGIPQELTELQQKGWRFSQALDQVRKNYDTGDWNFPIFVVPEINVVNPQQTPAADMISRETTQSETINVTVETEQPSPSFGLQTTDDTEGSYDYDDNTTEDLQYDVVGYGLASRLEDKMILVNDPIRSTQSVAEQAHLNGIRQTEERQILRGVEEEGWDGMTDLGNEIEEEKVDVNDEDVDYLKKVRKVIDEVEYEGGDTGSIGVFVDFETHRKLRNQLDDKFRYNEVGDGLGFGFRVLTIDNTPIMKTHGLVRQDQIGDGEEEPIIVAGDMSNHYMAMLQDVTVKPLAKVAPQEQFATDAYGVFVSEAPDHIAYVHAENPE